MRARDKRTATENFWCFCFMVLEKSKENHPPPPPPPPLVRPRVKLQTVIIYYMHFNTFRGSLKTAGHIIGCTFFVVYRWMGL